LQGSEDRRLDHPLRRHSLARVPPTAQVAAVTASLFDILVVDPNRRGSEKSQLSRFLWRVDIDHFHRSLWREIFDNSLDERDRSAGMRTAFKYQNFNPE
jgi:hypothetical protein